MAFSILPTSSCSLWLKLTRASSASHTYDSAGGRPVALHIATYDSAGGRPVGLHIATYDSAGGRPVALHIATYDSAGGRPVGLHILMILLEGGLSGSSVRVHWTSWLLKDRCAVCCSFDSYLLLLAVAVADFAPRSFYCLLGNCNWANYCYFPGH